MKLISTKVKLSKIGKDRLYVEKFLKSKIVVDNGDVLPIMLFHVLADSDNRPGKVSLYSIISSASEYDGKRTHYSEDTMEKFKNTFFEKGLRIYEIY